MMILYPYGLRKALTLSYDDGVEITRYNRVWQSEKYDICANIL